MGVLVVKYIINMSKHNEVDPRIAEQSSRWVRNKEALNAVPCDVTEQANLDPAKGIPETIILSNTLYQRLRVEHNTDEITSYIYARPLDQKDTLVVTVCGNTITVLAKYEQQATQEESEIEAPVLDRLIGAFPRGLLSRVVLSIFR